MDLSTVRLELSGHAVSRFVDRLDRPGSIKKQNERSENAWKNFRKSIKAYVRQGILAATLRKDSEVHHYIRISYRDYFYYAVLGEINPNTMIVKTFLDTRQFFDFVKTVKENPTWDWEVHAY